MNLYQTLENSFEQPLHVHVHDFFSDVFRFFFCVNLLSSPKILTRF